MIHILVVDDSLTIRVKFRDYLSKHGFEVHEASNGMEALEILKRNPEIKLIISDLNMPNMDGMTFIEFVRNEENRKDIPIMIYSTELDKNLKEEAKKLGCKGVHRMGNFWMPCSMHEVHDQEHDHHIHN